MTSKRMPRVMRADDFVAESLENMAAKLPPSQNAKADQMREDAKMFRESDRPGIIRLWENSEDAEDFIRPDDAAVQR